jgi:hypothetical protein
VFHLWCLRSGLNSGVAAAISGDVVDVAKRLVEQRGNVRIEEPVHDIAPASIADDESKVSQHPQLM